MVGYDSSVRFAFLFLCAVLFVGCGSIGLTVHNDTDGAVTIEGAGETLTVAAGERVRVDGLRTIGELVARDSAGAELQRVTPTAPPAGGEVVWSMAGTVCYAEADYGTYYNSEEYVIPAGVELIGALDPGERLYVSKGAVHTPPGGKLPARARRKAIAIVEVPCQAKRQGNAILRSWLEVALRDIQP